MNINTKQCSKCKTIKPVSEFYKKKRNKDGLDTICIACNKAYQDARKKQRTENEPITEGHKECCV